MADSTISGLTAATALQAADLAAVVQGGTTKKATLAQIQANSLPLAGGTMTGALVAPPSSFTNSGSSNIALTVGGDANATTRTNATNKYSILAGPHYTNAEQPLGMVYGQVTSTTNVLHIGGGSPAVNAATSIVFYSAANNTTTTGTGLISMNATGLGIGATPSSIFHVSATGDANALRVDDTTGNVGMGTAPTATAALDVASTTKGFLPPRMTTTQRDAIGTPATGLIAYNTTTNKVNVYTGSAWEAVTSA